jgi:hypothetical protein
MSSQAKIWGSQQVVTCPGKEAPVNIRLSLVMLNRIALAGVSGEVLTPIFQRLKKESRFPDTIMVTHANGLSGYIPNDDAYNQKSYEIESTRLKPGCAEGEIVNGILSLMKQY